jgi:hypothetical protein
MGIESLLPALKQYRNNIEQLTQALQYALSKVQLNIRAVSKKSSHKTVSEAITTVRVVARATPSGVGFAS